jgi:hypothetical protein
MSRTRLTLAVVGLALCLVGLGFTARHLLVRAQTAPPDPTINGIDVALIPSKPTLKAGDPVDIEVWVFPNGNEVTAAELRVIFDPAIFAPRLTTPFTPGNALTLILPNCTAGAPLPTGAPGEGGCPRTSSLVNNQALIYLGVNCQETGCPIPATNQKFLLATLALQAKPNTSGVTQINLNDPQHPTLTAALAFDNNATKIMSNTSLSLTPCDLTYDFQPDGTVNVVDIMQAAAKWNTDAGNSQYNGQFDVNRDGKIDITDIQTVANTWNTSCTNK